MGETAPVGGAMSAPEAKQMAKISIRDLEQNEDLDREAMAQILGGRPGEREGPVLGTRLLRSQPASAGLIPEVYDPTWRFEGNF